MLGDPRRTVESILAGGDIKVVGSEAEARLWDIVVRDERMFLEIVRRGSLGLGESYMHGMWDVGELDELITRILDGSLERKAMRNPRVILSAARAGLKAMFSNLQNEPGSRALVQHQYDKDFRLFEAFLDPYNQYSCGVWDGANDLDQAQENKLELLARKLDLKKDDRLLDIGCGWGGLAKYMAEKHGVHVTGVTLSKVQAEYARQFTRGSDVEIIEEDYRNLPGIMELGSFDKVISVGMMEHVGHKNYRRFMEVVDHVMADDGLFLLHTIATKKLTTTGDPWADKYIFHDSMLPALRQLMPAAKGLFTSLDFQDLCHHYDRTLMAWHQNFNRNWESLREADPETFNPTFKRMWDYYLLSSAGSFRAGHMRLFQTVFAKPGNSANADYKKVRHLD